MGERSAIGNYNGWANQKTWLVNLWLASEEPSYRYWTLQAREWHGKRAAPLGLARQFKREFSEKSPVDESTVYGQLVNAALEEVDWVEIAQSFLDEAELSLKRESHDVPKRLKPLIGPDKPQAGGILDNPRFFDE